MMKVLITGSNGLLGQKLVDLLLPMPEIELLATARGENRQLSQYPTLRYEQLDITNVSQTEELIAAFRPDCVLHTAAMTNVDHCETEREQCWKINVDGVENLLHACQKTGAHLVHVSTDFIFDGEAGPYDEQATPNPVNFYGESKAAAEKLLTESRYKNWAIARTVLVYGTLHDGSRSNIVLWVKNSLEQGKALKLVEDQLRSPTLAEDLAMGCWLIAKHKATGIYNISGKDLLTPYQMAIKVAEAFDLDKNLIEKTDSTTLQQPAKRPPRTGFNISKAVEELGYAPHSFDEGIKIIAQQVVQNKVAL